MAKTGTATAKFIAVTDTCSELINGFEQKMSVTFNCITLMKEYSNKSVEELRYEDYMIRKYHQESGVPYGMHDNGFPSESTSVYQSSDKALSKNTSPFDLVESKILSGIASGFGSAENSSSPANTSIFGSAGNTSSSANTSILGSADNKSSPANTSIFSSAENKSSFPNTSIFGSSENNSSPANTSIFGSAETKFSPANTSIFGFAENKSSSANTTIFGSAGNKSSSANSTIFGSSENKSSPANSSFFGSAEIKFSPANTSIFCSAGNKSSSPNTSIFGSAGNYSSCANTSIFGSAGNKSSSANTSIFGSAGNKSSSANNSIFGSAENKTFPANTSISRSAKNVSSSANTSFLGSTENKLPSGNTSIQNEISSGTNSLFGSSENKIISGNFSVFGSAKEKLSSGNTSVSNSTENKPSFGNTSIFTEKSRKIRMPKYLRRRKVPLTPSVPESKESSKNPSDISSGPNSSTAVCQGTEEAVRFGKIEEFNFNFNNNLKRLALQDEIDLHSSDSESYEEGIKLFVTDVQGIIECPVCFGSLDSELKQCESGHAICSSCFSNVTKCPTCQYAYLPQKPTLLCQILERLPKPCSFVGEGCDKIFFNKNEEHETFCKFRLTSCRFESCEWKGTVKSVIDHVKNCKQKSEYSLCEMYFPNVNIKQIYTIDNTQDVSFYSAIIFDNKLFWKYFHRDNTTKTISHKFYHITPSKPKQKYYLVIGFNAGEIEFKTCTAASYESEIDFENRGSEISFVVPDEDLKRFFDTKAKGYAYTQKIVVEDISDEKKFK